MVFKSKRKGADGQTKTAKNYTIRFIDHKSQMREVASGTADQSAAIRVEVGLKEIVGLRKSGIAPFGRHADFIESLSATNREKLAKWGIIEPARAAAGMDIESHITAWQTSLAAKNREKHHIRKSGAYVLRVAQECGWRTLSDIAAADLDNWINTHRKAGLSLGTLNHYLVSVKSFVSYLNKERRITDNPLAHVARLNVATDRRTERRALTADELTALLTAAQNGDAHHGLTGPARALLYRLAASTGLRFNELRTLTRADFDLASTPATVTVRAQNAKNRRTDTLPLQADLAADLRQHCALMLPGARVFSMWTDRGAAMIRRDLEAAGVPYIDECGQVADFHSLRGTFCTMLARGGVPLATAQKMMRHSDPKLTANFYTHILLTDKADALDKLPVIQAAPAAMVMTGTDATAEQHQADGREKFHTKFHTDSGQNLSKHGKIDTTCGVYSRGYIDGKTDAADMKKPQKTAVFGAQNGWWARRDSNPRPSDYEAAAQKTDADANCELSNTNSENENTNVQLHTDFHISEQNNSIKNNFSKNSQTDIESDKKTDAESVPAPASPAQPAELPVELRGIAEAWNDAPESIRAACVAACCALLSPYMKGK